MPLLKCQILFKGWITPQLAWWISSIIGAILNWWWSGVNEWWSEWWWSRWIISFSNLTASSYKDAYPSCDNLVTQFIHNSRPFMKTIASWLRSSDSATQLIEKLSGNFTNLMFFENSNFRTLSCFIQGWIVTICVY